MKAAAQRLQQLTGAYEQRQAELLAQVGCAPTCFGRHGAALPTTRRRDCGSIIYPLSPLPPAPCPSQQVVSVAATFLEVWRHVSATLAELDVLAGFAEVAASAPAAYVRPTMLPSDGGWRWQQRQLCGEREHRQGSKLQSGNAACNFLASLQLPLEAAGGCSTRLVR